jgi:hypothetical protein
MDEFTPEEIAAKKKAIFDSMGKRGQKQVMRVGYDKWDPVQTPKDPIDIRSDKTKRTTQQLIRLFLQQTPHEGYSNAFGQGAFDMAMGIVNSDDRIRGMYEFSLWYRELLIKEGHEPA